jgi:hypothetical protein
MEKSRDIIGIIKRRLRWVGHLDRLGKYFYIVLVEEPLGNCRLRDQEEYKVGPTRKVGGEKTG